MLKSINTMFEFDRLYPFYRIAKSSLKSLLPNIYIFTSASKFNDMKIIRRRDNRLS